MFAARLLLVLSASCGRIAFDDVCSADGPCVSAMTLNAGAVYARGPRLAVTMRVTGDAPPFEVRVSEECELADIGWTAATEPIWIVVEPSDGSKRVCAWARDANGAVSEMRADTILYEAERVPTVEAFEVVPIDATHMRASWTVADAEGLSAIDLDYTTDESSRATWLPLRADIAATGTSATGSLDLEIPTAQPFVVRVVPRDRAGNRGIAAVSSGLNTGDWSVYLGSRDRGIGGAALAARMTFMNNTNQQVAIDPVTHDVYAEDREFGILKLDAATGTVELFLRYANVPVLPDDGPLTPASAVPVHTALRMGPDRKLYVSPGNGIDNDTMSGVLYQIDPDTRHCRRYLGGGIGNDATTTPSAVFMFKWVFAFDEAGSIYFLTSCIPGDPDPPNRLLKVTQQPDGRAGTVSVVAGNCAAGTLPNGGPYDALGSLFPGFIFRGIGTLAVWDGGRTIYAGSYPNEVWKIIDGQLYSSNIGVRSGGTLAYDDTSGHLLAADDSSIVAYQPHLSGAGGDTMVGVVASGTGTGACTMDGVPAGEACVSATWAIQPTSARIYFVDGPRVNQARTYRVRFVDRAGRIRTYLGSPSLTGAEFDRRSVRGSFGGIAYKPITAMNQAAFPAGLYVADGDALIVGYVDPANDRLSVLWGNQSNVPVHHATGASVSAADSLGIAYPGNVEALALDSEGLPWLRYGDNDAYLLRLDATRRVVELQTGPGDWENATDTTNPRALNMWPYGVASNLTLKDRAAFLFGGYAQINPTPSARLLDFVAGTSVKIMGGVGTGYTPDRTTPGTVTNATIDSDCLNGSMNCHTHYRADQDRLYFSEDQRIRYITTPSNPATATLITLFSAPVRVLNFTFRPDGSQVFYTSGGKLRCHDLSSGQPWCNDTDLGPPEVFGVIARGPNQLTWRDSNALLISTYKGHVLEYSVP